MATRERQPGAGRRALDQLVAACDLLHDAARGIDGEARRRFAAGQLARLLLLALLEARGWIPHGTLAQLASGPEPDGATALRHALAALPFLGGLLPPTAIPGGSPQLDRAGLARPVALLADLRWELDDSAAESVVTPASLGDLFERYVDRRQAGAYYTQRDVTSYIATATLVPALLDALRAADPGLLEADGALPRLLRGNPDRYLFGELRRGDGIELPAGITAGLGDAGQRRGWDAPADAALALHGESWRDVVARRARLAELRAALASGAPITTARLISWNLDMRRLLLDLAELGPAPTVAALWQAIHSLTVLDPTCGTGAFLLAALDVLAVPAAACVARFPELAPGHDAAMVRAAIVSRCLYGVDLMDEAAEICRMRLWLRLAAQAERPTALHDVRLNVAAGNALVGLTRWPAVGAGGDEAQGCQATLDAALAAEYGLATDAATMAGWRSTHRPLHWCAAFPDVMAAGGFAAVIGNPPYVAYRPARLGYAVHGYRTIGGGNLYALVVERSLALLREGGRLGMILPIASVATESMRPLQELYDGSPQWHSHYAVRPGKLFPDVDMNLTITLLEKRAGGECASTGYRRWTRGGRGQLFPTLAYTRLPRLPGLAGPLPKIGSPLEVSLLERMLSHGHMLGDYAAPGGAPVYYHSGGRYWRKALREKLSSHYRPLHVAPALAPIVLALLNSQLFYWYWIISSNCMDVVAREVRGLPVFALDAVDPAPFVPLVEQLLTTYRAASGQRRRSGARIRVVETNFDARAALPTIDAIDELLAVAYGFDGEQLDFVRSFDRKFRLRER